MEGQIWHYFFVCVYNALYVVNLRVEYVAIDGKALGNYAFKFVKFGTESIGWYLFISIIVLQYLANCSYSLNIFVVIVYVVKRSLFRWNSI